jgi:hypothetical protein
MRKIKITDKILQLEQGFNVLVTNERIFDDFLKLFNWNNVSGFVGIRPFTTKEDDLLVNNETKVFYLDDVYYIDTLMSGSRNTTDVKGFGDEAIKSVINHLDSKKYDFIVVNDVLNKINPLLQIELIKKLESLNTFVLFIEKNPLILQLCNVKVNWFISDEQQIEMKTYQNLIKNYGSNR